MALGQIIGQTPVNPKTTASNVEYDNSKTSSIITGQEVQTAIDQLFTSVSNGKNKIASAITDKGVSTSGNSSFDVMAQNIGKIQSSKIEQKTIHKELSINDSFKIELDLGYAPNFVLVKFYPILNDYISCPYFFITQGGRTPNRIKALGSSWTGGVFSYSTLQGSQLIIFDTGAPNSPITFDVELTIFS